jgi:hypothetical protein
MSELPVALLATAALVFGLPPLLLGGIACGIKLWNWIDP